MAQSTRNILRNKLREMQLRRVIEIQDETLVRYASSLPLNEIINVVGPFIYSEYEDKGVRFAFFGEIHTIREYPPVDKEHTIGFSSFLHCLLQQKPTTLVDFYCEIPHSASDVNAFLSVPDNTLSFITSSFIDCFKLEKICPYPNLRAHYCDIRHILGISSYEYQELYDRMGNEEQYIAQNYKCLTQPLEYYNMLSSDVITKLRTNPLINKELSKSYYEKEIKAFANFEYDDNNKEFNTLLETYDINDVNKQIDLIYIYQIRFAVLMDVYTLARMFRNFKGGPEIKHVIFYGGVAHTRTYERFMAFIGAKQLFKEEDNNKKYMVTFGEDAKAGSFLF